MKILKRLAAVFAVLCSIAFAQTVPVTGTLLDASGHAIPGAFVKFELYNCGSNSATISGVGWTVAGSVTAGTFTFGETVVQASTNARASLIGIVLGSNPMALSLLMGTANNSNLWTGITSGATYTPTGAPVQNATATVVVTTVTMNANSQGVVSGTIVANDIISCGGIFDTTRWYVTPMVSSVKPIKQAQRYHITLGGGTFNFNTAMVDTSAPPQPAWSTIFGNPIKDQLWKQPPGTKGVFLGEFDFTGAIVDGLAPVGGGGGGSGAPNQSVSFYSAISATLAISGANPNIVWACFDNDSPANAFAPDTVTIDASYNVTFNFAQLQSGYCVVNSSSGVGNGPVSGISGITTLNGTGLIGGVNGGTANLSLLKTCSQDQVLAMDMVLGWRCADQSGIGGGGGPVSPGPGYNVVSSPTVGLTPINQIKPNIDVRDGYGGSGGIDCTGATNPTTTTAILQAMINNAPNFSKFILPNNCIIKINGSPAITLDSRYGLEFEAAGRQINSCDSEPYGVGGAQFQYVQSYASGNTVFYVNRSQRLSFKNITIIANGTADIVWNVDQVGATPPINTSNLWENTCIANASYTQNPNFKGWAFSTISLSNVENMRIIRPYVECSSTLATTASSNGTGIWFSTSANQKQEIVEQPVFQGCSVGVNSGQGSDNTMFTGLDSTSYSGDVLQGFNDAVWGKRYEYNTYPISIQSAIGPHMIEHSDFGATYGTPVTCPNGCGMVTMINNESDDPTVQWFTTNPSALTGSLIAFNNRNSHFNTLQWPYGSFILGANEIDSGSVARGNLGSYSYAQLLLTPSTALSGQSFPSPALALESTNGTYPTINEFVLQNVPAGIGTPTAETLVIGNYTNYLTLPQWISFAGNFSGLNIAQAPTPTFGSGQVSYGGTAGSTTYSYKVVAVGGSGTTAASSIGTTTSGNATLSSTNYNVLALASSAGAVSYNIYRTACGGSSALCTGGTATGLIANVPAYILAPQTASTAYYFNDTGLAGDGGTPPSTNTTGGVTVASQVDVQEIFAPSNPASGYERWYADSTTHALTCLTSSGGSCGGGGGGGGATWQRQGVVIAPTSTDPSPQMQEVSAIVDSAPEILTSYAQVVKMTWTCGWWPASLGGPGLGICGGESPDGITPPTRLSSNPIIADHARSWLMTSRVGGNLVLYATNYGGGGATIDQYTGTTLASLTLAHSNVLACGSNGNELVGTTGNTAVWIYSGTWYMLYDCVNTGATNTYSDWLATSSNGYTWTKYSGTPVIGYGSGVTMGGNCGDCGGPYVAVINGALHAWVHGGPAGEAVPTPYIYHLVDTSLTGHSWVADATPALTAQTLDEGVGVSVGQIADAYLLDLSALSTNTRNPTTALYYAAYTNGCSAQASCGAPSYIKAATINLPLTSIVGLTQSDGSANRAAPIVQVNGASSSVHGVLNLTGAWITDQGNGTVSLGSSTGAVVVGSPPATGTVSDTFVRSPGALGANWSGSANVAIQSSGSVGDITTASTNDFDWYSGASFFADQCSSVTVSALPQNNLWMGLSVRETSATNGYFLAFFPVTGTPTKISYYFYGNAFTMIGGRVDTVATMTIGDIFTFCAVGSTLTAYRNGLPVAAETDTTVAGPGYPGIGFAGVSPANTGRISLWGGTGLSGTTCSLTASIVGGLNICGTTATVAPSGDATLSSITSGGAKFTSSGGLDEASLLGGATAGQFTTSTVTTGSTVITMGGGVTAPNGWHCSASDKTHPTDIIVGTSLSTATATLTIASAITLNDVIEFSCTGY